MKILISAAFVALGLLAAPTASAVNPVDCAFNPAVTKGHPSECKDVTVESVASNGGPEPLIIDPEEGGNARSAFGR